MASHGAAPHVSVIIPTRNGMPLLEACIRGVLAQCTPWPFEVIVIDSESTDGSWEFLEQVPVRRGRVARREFNHGRTRDAAAAQARGEFLVFLVQDAIPADTSWLANLVAAFDDPRIAGAYSRQLARPESNPLTHYMACGTTPTGLGREVKMLPPEARLTGLAPQQQLALALFQNNSSCIRRSVWRTHPFGDVPYGEDIAWGKRIIEAGHAIAYTPASTVYHSHDRSALYALKRGYADHFQATQLFNFVMVPSLARAVRLAASESLHACRYVAAAHVPPGTRLRYLVLAPIFMSALTAGQYLGARMSRWLGRHPWLARVDTALRAGV